METPLIITLYAIWFVFWGFYNFFLIKRQITTEKTPQILVPIYSFISIALLTLTFSFTAVKGIIFVILILIGIFTRTKYSGRVANSAFQMIWLASVATVINPSVLLLAICFLIGHLPIIFIQHINISGKLLILLFSFLGGCILAIELLYLSQPLGLALMVITHFLTYIFIRPYDNKYNWGIIN